MKLFFFWSPKNDMKVGKICIKFSWNSNISVQRCLILDFNGPFFCCPIFFEDISPPPPPSQDQQNGKYSVNTTFVFQDWSQGCIFHKLLKKLPFSRMLLEYSPKLVYSTMVGKNFKTYVIHIPRKCTESRPFYSCPPLPSPSPGTSPDFHQKK